MNSIYTGRWSTEKELWSELNKIGRDTTWSMVKFDENSSQIINQNTKGVYLICAYTRIVVVKQQEEEKILRTVLYAGRSTSCLRKRFLDHIKSPEPPLQAYLKSFHLKMEFYYTKVSDNFRISDLENLLIETFNPPCNSIRGPGTAQLLARLDPQRIIGA